MENVDLSATRPADYLREGLLSADGQIREGINGQYSLGMAHRLKQAGVHPDTVKALLDSLKSAAEKLIRKDAENAPLPDNAQQSVQAAWSATGPTGTGVLGELRTAVLPWVKDTRSLAATLLHLERILRQLALLNAAPKP